VMVCQYTTWRQMEDNRFAAASFGMLFCSVASDVELGLDCKSEYMVLEMMYTWYWSTGYPFFRYGAFYYLRVLSHYTRPLHILDAHSRCLVLTQKKARLHIILIKCKDA
jgi:hypothetical protein